MAWWDEAYAAMLRKLRKRFGEGDLIYEAAAERWIKMREWSGPTPKTTGELVGLCLKFVEEKALDLLREQGRRKTRWVPLEEIADRRADPSGGEIRALLRAQETCLGRLPARRRLLLRWYYEEGLSDREIASRRVQKAKWGRAARGGSEAEKAAAGEVRRRAIEATRKAVSRERRAALEGLRLLVEAEGARADSPAA